MIPCYANRMTRPGRKPYAPGAARTRRLSVPLTDAERDRIRKAAADEGADTAPWCREVLLREADATPAPICAAVEELATGEWIATADGITGMGVDRTRALLDLERRRREHTGKPDEPATTP